MKTKLVYVFVVFTILVAIIEVLAWYPSLPALVPSHFNAQGQPDGWLSRDWLAAGNLILQCLIIGSSFGLAGLLNKMPTGMINLPNRDYWLADSRRAPTIVFLKRYLVLISAISCWLMMILFHLTGLVAIGHRGSINPEFWIVIGVYVALLVASVIHLHRRFGMPDRD